MLLSQLIKESGMTYKEVAEKSGVNRHTIHSWLYSKRSPSFHNLQAVLNTIGYELKLEKLNDD